MAPASLQAREHASSVAPVVLTSSSSKIRKLSTRPPSGMAKAPPAKHQDLANSARRSANQLPSGSICLRPRSRMPRISALSRAHSRARVESRSGAPDNRSTLQQPSRIPGRRRPAGCTHRSWPEVSWNTDRPSLRNGTRRPSVRGWSHRRQLAGEHAAASAANE
jgi:hypothetical protein